MEYKLFPCYSMELKDYLMKKGFRYELVGLNPNTKYQFFVFINTPRLLKCIDEWKLKSAEK